MTADCDHKWYFDVDPSCQHQDLTKLTYADNTFDAVVANHIMEHVPDDRRAAREVLRVLRPGGRAILQMPYATVLSSTLKDLRINDPAEQSRLFGQQGHVRIDALDDYDD